MSDLPANHLLSLGRPDALIGPPAGAPDTTTLAAHDFDVDNRTGFMPPQPPMVRLLEQWESWELVLDDAMQKKLQHHTSLDITEEDVAIAEQWRETVRQMPILPVGELTKSEVTLRRAHLLLVYILHFYVHTQPPKSKIVIPPPLTLPLLQVCQQLQLAPVVTYCDTVLYNWALKDPSQPWSSSGIPDLYNLRTNSSFSSTKDEEEFYLTSARMELRGVEALTLMRNTMDEVFVGDEIAVRRITDYLTKIAHVEREMKDLLMKIREGCQPDVFYNKIRPWYNGSVVTSDPTKLEYNEGEWVWDGIEMDRTLKRPTDLAGTSAGQSPLFHSLDIFLGVGSTMGDHPNRGLTANTEDKRKAGPILKAMQLYMARHHRSFLHHLEANKMPLRLLVESKMKEVEGGSDDQDAVGLVKAYNEAVSGLKELRDAHMIIVTLYILGPARRRVKEVKRREEEKARELARIKEKESRSGIFGAINGFTGLFGRTDGPSDLPASVEEEPKKKGVQGTGGTDFISFLKGVRDMTAHTVLKSDKSAQN